MTTSTGTATHSHYYDYGYSDWAACIQQQVRADFCIEKALKLDNEGGCEKADRRPAGLLGSHHANNKVHPANNNVVVVVGA